MLIRGQLTQAGKKWLEMLEEEKAWNEKSVEEQEAAKS